MKKDTLMFSRLHIADLSFRQVRALSDQLSTSSIDTSALTLTPQMAGIVVTYAKNFVGATGFGPLTDLLPEFAQFSDSGLEATHKKILEARHKLYAHRDALAAANFDYDNESEAEPYQVRISIYTDGSGFTARPNVPELNPEILPLVSNLASFQIERINPLFPALRSSPTAVSGASRQKQIPSSDINTALDLSCAPNLVATPVTAGPIDAQLFP